MAKGARGGTAGARETVREGARETVREDPELDESESDFEEVLGGAEGLLVIEYSGTVLKGGVCEREIETEDEEANG